DAIEVVDVQRHAGLMRHGHEVQDAVGRAACGGDTGNRIVNGGASEDVARADASLQDVHDQPATVEADVTFARVLRWHAGRAHGGEAAELERQRHRVGGELPAAGASARA